MANLEEPACEFCDELMGESRSRFNVMYPKVGSRIIARNRGFVALPTLGQIFPGSLLILPENHVESCARLPLQQKLLLCDFLGDLLDITQQFGYPAFFEHGAQSYTGGSCGIYHAHLHLVPLPHRIPVTTVLPDYRSSAEDLCCALRDLSNSDHYLLFGYENKVVYSQVKDMVQYPESQYFRRILTEYLGVSRPWNWREYTTPEPDLIATIQAYGNAHASHS